MSIEQKRKLKIIHQIIEGKLDKLPEEPRGLWYGDTFDSLYDSPISLLNSQLRISSWAKSK